MSTRRLSHVPYSHRVSPPTHILWGWVRNERKLKAGLHSLYWQGFSLVWFLACWIREQLSQKALQYSSHSKGFSPMWILLPQKKTEGWRRPFHIHCTQGFYPVRTHWWWVKKQLSRKAYQHTLYSETLSSVGNSSGLLRKAFSCSLQSGLHFGTNC